MGTALNLVSSTAYDVSNIRAVLGGALFITLFLFLINLFWRSKLLRMLCGFLLIIGVASVSLFLLSQAQLVIKGQWVLTEQGQSTSVVFLCGVGLVALLTAIRPLTLATVAAVFASRKGLGDENHEAMKVPIYYVASYVGTTIFTAFCFAALYQNFDGNTAQDILFITSSIATVLAIVFLFAYFGPTPTMPRLFAQFVNAKTIKKPTGGSAVQLGLMQAVLSLGYVLTPLAILAGFAHMLSIDTTTWIVVFGCAYTAVYIAVLMFLFGQHVSSVTVLAWVAQSKRLMWLSVGLLLAVLGWLGLLLITGDIPL